MNMPPETITRVRILNRDYDVRGTDPEYVRRLGDLVDQRMKKVTVQTGTVDTVKVAILAALDIADEFLTSQQELERLRNRVETWTSTIMSRLQDLPMQSP